MEGGGCFRPLRCLRLEGGPDGAMAQRRNGIRFRSAEDGNVAEARGVQIQAGLGCRASPSRKGDP